MKYFELDKNEKQIVRDYEEGNLRRVKKVESAKRQYRRYAKLTLEKTRNINIRLSQKDLVKLKSKAVAEGIPYQTLVTSILHRFVATS